MSWPALITRTATPYRWLALAVLGSVQFLLVLDDTVVNVALASSATSGLPTRGWRGW